MPPMNSFAILFILISAKMQPTNNILENKSVELKLIENVINKIIDTNTWETSNEKKHFAQALKIHENLVSIRVIIAKGEIRIKNLIIIYRSEYVKTKLNNPIEIKLLIMPSVVNMLKFEDSTYIVELRF